MVSARGITCLALALAAFAATAAALPTVRSHHPETSSLVRTYTGVFPPSLLVRLEKECRLIAEFEKTQPSLLNSKYSTRWFPKGQLPRTAIEEAIVRLRKIANPGPKNVGAEWWIQMVDAGPGGSIGWHVDKDESVASNKHYLLHPELGSIFYLTDVGGPTVITEQWSPHGSGYVPEKATHGFISRPERNKYLIFHGELLHGVAGGGTTQPVGTKRLTFLVNWWDVKPEEPNCSVLKYSSVPKLELMSSHQLRDFRAELDADIERLAAVGVKMKRQSIPDADMSGPPGGKGRLGTYAYNFNLPGGASASLTLPNEVSKETSTLHLWWTLRKPATSTPKQEL